MSGSTTNHPSLRNNCLTLYTQAAIAETEKTPTTWSEPPAGTDEVPGPNQQTDGPGDTRDITSPSSLPATQRKLPIPHTGANSNANLKGILIKPKRILPAQPEISKLKLSSQEAPQSKAQVADGENSQVGLKNQDAKDKPEISPKQTKLPKLQIDVDRLKTYFLSHGGDGHDTKKSSLSDSEPGLKKSVTARSHGHSGYTPHTYFGRDSALCNFNPPDGLSKVREWCSDGDVNKVTTKMASDNQLVKDRNIRSPSPKSNTTWDRSSSGYSSDERGDPRSPPPREIVSAVSKPGSNCEDDGYSVNEAKCEKEDSVPAITVIEKEESANSEVSSSNVNDVNSDVAVCDCGADDATVVDNEGPANVCSCTASNGANSVDITDQNQNTVHTKDETLNSGTNIPILDNSIGQKQQGSRRPAWSLTVPPASGRIQYRKSGSESVISLRHPSRQGLNGDKIFDGLEVCGKSYPQVPNTAATKLLTDSASGESIRADYGTKTDSNFSPSAFAPVEKAITPSTEIATELVPKSEVIKQDSAFKTRIMRQLAPPRSPRDIKCLSLSLAGKLPIAQNDKDIRKTLHDLSSPRRSPGGKTAPIRARHIIHPTSGSQSSDSTSNGQPMVPTAFSSFQRVNTNPESVGSKQAVKFFGKKMWRPPQGQPENAQMRPFSPFGGTLPPSKIQENEQKRHDHDQ